MFFTDSVDVQDCFLFNLGNQGKLGRVGRPSFFTGKVPKVTLLLLLHRGKILILHTYCLRITRESSGDCAEYRLRSRLFVSVIALRSIPTFVTDFHGNDGIREQV